MKFLHKSRYSDILPLQNRLFKGTRRLSSTSLWPFKPLIYSYSMAVARKKAHPAWLHARACHSTVIIINYHINWQKPSLFFYLIIHLHIALPKNISNCLIIAWIYCKYLYTTLSYWPLYSHQIYVYDFVPLVFLLFSI